MYAIKTRNGQVYMKLQSNGGDTAVMQVSQPQTVCASDGRLCSDCLYGATGLPKRCIIAVHLWLVTEELYSSSLQGL